ncbi:MAG: hypothetical protein OXN97_17830 [Bryobacterales bacterium]|nr:hypothetical protein [Bryobacterales bacterium]
MSDRGGAMFARLVIAGGLLAVILGVPVIYTQTADTDSQDAGTVVVEPGPWRMQPATIRAQLTNRVTETTSFTDQPTVFLYNTKTGIVYQYFNDCTLSDTLTNDCFSIVPIQHLQSATSNFGTLPLPTEDGQPPPAY